MTGRIWLKPIMAVLKPRFTSPIWFSLGMATLSKISSQVETPRMPIFRSWRPTLKPGVSVGTMK
jgi:hypothetical protein